MITYYKAKIVPSDDSTWVYWCEDEFGHAKDILKSDIPPDTKVIDKTYSN